MLRLLLLILLIEVLAVPVGAATPVVSAPVQLCDAAGCRPTDLTAIRKILPGTRLIRSVFVSQAYAASGRRVIVELDAMASAEIRWNGKIVARNGKIGGSAEEEVPGRYSFSMAIPPRLVKVGENQLVAALSSQNLRLSVRYPVNSFRAVADDAGSGNPYLPALLALGTLAIAGAYFGSVALLRRAREPMLLALMALSSLCQLALEIARVFVPYAYTWHVPRLAGIAVLAAATVIVASDYAATRFARHRRGRVRAAVGLVLAIVLIGAPSFDLKAAGALLTGALALFGCGLIGARRKVPGARAAVAVAVAFGALLVGGQGYFLDNIYYLALAALLASLVVAQVWELGRTETAHAEEQKRAANLADELRELRQAKASDLIAIRDGTRRHLLPPSAVTHVQAEDDYCQVRCTDGRTILATTSLSKLHGTLPQGFRRVHKSFVVNMAQVASLGRRLGGGRQLLLKDGTKVPIGRAYASEVDDWAAGSRA